VLPEVRDGGLEDGGLVHLPIVGAHHVAQLGHQIVELKRGNKALGFSFTVVMLEKTCKLELRILYNLFPDFESRIQPDFQSVSRTLQEK
jgi:hypothetical protein